MICSESEQVWSRAQSTFINWACVNVSISAAGQSPHRPDVLGLGHISAPPISGHLHGSGSFPSVSGPASSLVWPSHILPMLHYLIPGRMHKFKRFDVITRRMRSKWRCWNVVMECYYKCPNGLDTLLIKANAFLPAVALQVRPDGHERDRMAGAEFPADRECQESWRTHQWGTIKLARPLMQPSTHCLLNLLRGWRSQEGPNGHWLPSVFWGVINQIPKWNKISLEMNSLAEERKTGSRLGSERWKKKL